MTQELDREKLEQIAACDPSWLLMDIKQNSVFDASVLEQVFELAKAQARALLATPAPLSDEPVAWRHSKTLCLYETEEEVPLADGDEWAEPLYAAPPAPSSDAAGAKPVAEVVNKYGDPDAFAERDLIVNEEVLKALPFGTQLFAAPPATPSDKQEAGDALETLVAVLNAIGYTEEFAAAHPNLKVSEGVKLFLSEQGNPAYQECINENGLWMDTSKQTYDDIMAGKLSSRGVRVVYAAPPAQSAEQDRIDAEPDELLEVVKHTIATIGRQLDLIAERAPGKYLDKGPVWRSLTQHKIRLERAVSAHAKGASK